MALIAWLVFPLCALAVCVGIGLLAERLAGAELYPAVVPALGFAAATVVLAPLFATGAHGWLGSALLVALALAGYVVGDARRLMPGLGAVTGAAAYALHIAPVALTGSATFLGYNLLNDTAIHLALVDWIGDHGSRWIAQAPSSYGATINDYVGSRYPLGSHELLAALKPLVARDPAELYQPFLALCAGLAAAAIFGILRERIAPRAAAAIAFAALASQLVFSFALQGSIKELAFIACLAAAAGVVRSPPLLALPAAALYAIYGVYALPWIAPLGLVALVLTRPRVRAAAGGVVVFALAIAVNVPDSIRYYNHGHNVITSGRELGPLAGPIKPIQAAGIWLGGDYRFTPSHLWLTYLLAGVVVALALYGTTRALRRRDAEVLAFVLTPLIAYVITAPKSSPYIDAKLLAILSPAVVVAAGLGLSALAWRRVALAAAVVLAGALFVSDALAYRIALPAPMDRLGELRTIDDRYAGRGPILVNEFEEYVKHFMRRSRGSDPYERWTGGRAQLRDPTLPVTAQRYDLDQMKPSFVERWPLIALRRSPVASRPPSNYERVWRGRFYELWRRRGPAPLTHVALGRGTLDPAERLDCKLVRRLRGSGDLVAAIRPQPRLIPFGTGALPPGWYRYGKDPGMLEIHKGGELGLPAARGGGPVHFWIRGRTTRSDELAAGTRTLAIRRSDQRATEWIDIGSAGAGGPLTLRRPKRSLRPGDAQPDIVGPLAAVPAREPLLVRGAQLRKACGAPADWIDVIRR